VTPACPRCGYDLSGTIATWADSCPLAGLCSECGLEFDWADVHDPDRNRVRGLFEHARGPWQAARWLELTWLLALWPPRFWRRVRLEAPVNARRAALWPILITLVVWCAGSLLWNAASLAIRYQAMPAPRRSRSNGLLVELANGWLQPVAWVEQWPGVAARVFRWSGELRGWPRFLMPAAAMSLAWVVLIAVVPATLRAAKVRRVHVLRAVAYSFAWVALLALFHLIDGLNCVMRALVDPGQYLPAPQQYGAGASALLFDWWPALLVGITLWQLLWWHSALRTGFRLRSGLRIWGTLAFAASLAWLVALILSGGLAQLMTTYGVV
jgi:hypothetical protein